MFEIKISLFICDGVCLEYVYTKGFPQQKKKITKSLGTKKLSKLTRREQESIGELPVASVGGAALAVSRRNAEVRPHTAGQVLRHT